MSRVLRCCLKPAIEPAKTSPAPATRVEAPAKVPARVSTESEQMSGSKIVLQPRLCTLRSYGTEPIAVVKRGGDGDDAALDSSSSLPFFEVLTDYIESSKKSQDFEIISGRLAMIVFAATVTTEMVTGNSIFRKADLAGIEEAAGVSLAAVTLAAAFAWFSSARARVGRIFTVNCNSFIDALIDQIIDGLFYDNESGAD